MRTIVNLKCFKEKFVSGLVFSMIEGLKEGEEILFRSESSMDSFCQQLKDLALPGVECVAPAPKDSLWELHIHKLRHSHD